VGKIIRGLFIVLGLSDDKKINGNNKIPAKHRYYFIKSPLLRSFSF